MEGADGSGKTTIRRHIYRRMVEAGHEVFNTRSFSWLDVRTTQLIANARWLEATYNKEELISAYVTDKQMLWDQIVQPQLQHRHVMSDRYIVSDLVYNSVLFDIDPDQMWEAYRQSNLQLPDRIIYIDTSVDECARRIDERSIIGRNRWDEREYQARIHILLRKFLTDPRLTTAVVQINNTQPLEVTLAFVDQVIIPDLVRTQ